VEWPVICLVCLVAQLPREGDACQRRGCLAEDRTVAQVVPVEVGSAAGSVSCKWHVSRGIEALVARTVELAAKTACLIVVQPGCVILKVQDQP
jgi:hypothetical protein